MDPAAPTVEILGHPPEGPALRLDHERFAYAGKFVMTNTGKAVVREDGEIVAAVAFNRDRTDETVGWLRYLTVRNDRQGEGLGPRIAAGVARHLYADGATLVRIAVNNPYAYVACYRAGFAYTNRETGIAEVVLEHSRDTPERSNGNRDRRFREGLEALLEAADRPAEQREFVEKHRAAGVPEPFDADLTVDGGDGSSDGPHD